LGGCKKRQRQLKYFVVAADGVKEEVKELGRIV
jgi:hypothetical protein